jgi:hypothetical protein
MRNFVPYFYRRLWCIPILFFMFNIFIHTWYTRIIPVPRFLYLPLSFIVGGRRDRMVVGFTTTSAISAYYHWSCEFESCSWRGVFDATLCDKFSVSCDGLVVCTQKKVKKQQKIQKDGFALINVLVGFLIFVFLITWSYNEMLVFCLHIRFVP